MKKTIEIEISYPDCDMLNITDLDLAELEIEAIGIFGIAEEVRDDRWSINAKVIEQ